MATKNSKPRELAITPYYAKGDPVDVASLSLQRAKALTDLLESYHFEGDADAHTVPVDAPTLYLVVCMVGEHVSMAREALDSIPEEA